MRRSFLCLQGLRFVTRFHWQRMEGSDAGPELVQFAPAAHADLGPHQAVHSVGFVFWSLVSTVQAAAVARCSLLDAVPRQAGRPLFTPEHAGQGVDAGVCESAASYA